MAYFENGDRVAINSGGEAVVTDRLGEGGQGVVYKVKYGNAFYALKWYLPGKIQEPKRFYDNLENNAKRGAPTGAFLWPKFLTTQQNGSFGYLMDLRPNGYKDFGDFLLARTHFSGFDAVTNAALNIVNGFRELHRAGLSYQDLNDGNFFINPATGDVLICDNDNVAPYGENLGIAGKARFMAPEVVTHKKMPDIHTDRFSLAAVLFMMLFLSHPLEGQQTMVPCMTEELEYKFYGTGPVFIYDDNDGRNRPVPGVNANVIKIWPVYPEFIREAFKTAFSYKMLVDDPEHRITESEWQKLFVRLRDQTVECACGKKTFADFHAQFSNCTECGQKLPAPLVLKIRGYEIAMYPGNKLYRCHISDTSDDYKEVVGEVLLSKGTPVKLGLRNLSDIAWSVAKPDGSAVPLQKNQVVVVGKGLKLTIGRFAAEVTSEVGN